MKYLMVLFFSFFITTVLYAEEVHILCPEPSSVTFHYQGDEYMWGRFKVSGFAKIITGNFPGFAMTSFTDNNIPPTEMYGASYFHYDGAFICNYFGKSPSGERHAFLIVYADIRPIFPEECYFKVNHQDECNGDVQACELVCKR